VATEILGYLTWTEIVRHQVYLFIFSLTQIWS